MGSLCPTSSPPSPGEAPQHCSGCPPAPQSGVPALPVLPTLGLGHPRPPAEHPQCVPPPLLGSQSPPPTALRLLHAEGGLLLLWGSQRCGAAPRFCGVRGIRDPLLRAAAPTLLVLSAPPCPPVPTHLWGHTPIPTAPHLSALPPVPFGAAARPHLSPRLPHIAPFSSPTPLAPSHPPSRVPCLCQVPTQVSVASRASSCSAAPRDTRLLGTPAFGVPHAQGMLWVSLHGLWPHTVHLHTRSGGSHPHPQHLKTQRGPWGDWGGGQGLAGPRLAVRGTGCAASPSR